MPSLIIGRKMVSYDIAVPVVELPDYIEEISAKAFYGKGYIIELILPEGIRAIGDNAFQDCYAMKRLVLPRELDEMGQQVFLQCRSLESVDLPEGVRELGPLMFGSCTSLREIRIPATVCSIDENAFSGASKLRRIHISTDHIGLLPEKYRSTAALTAMSDLWEKKELSGDSGSGASELLDGIVREDPEAMATMAIEERDKPALVYMLDRKLIPGSLLPELTEKAVASRATELAAVLLEAANIMREDETSGDAAGDGTGAEDWDPFA
ncbi:leucine-rich repeat domain-containing protein [Mobilibacterium timonense]|uniref:leucine-rich repeat domain-containing protein n=1 Tax=Mobilibacterium timonense TaxID=1871012 RepID=UPI0009864E1A|nr:leucine-rich repeat domain-containing protein [Mobilibacterium timonense]